MTIPENPFKPARFEHEDHHIIWMSPQIKQLYGKQTFYLFGTRGSGKTSMLKALNWYERLNNASVLQQIRDEDPTSEFLSIYLKLPDYVAGAFARTDWSKAYPSGSVDALHEAAFALFIELLSLGQVLEGVEALRAHGKLFIDAASEEKFVRSVRRTMRPWTDEKLDNLSGLIESINDCALLIRRLVLRGPTSGNADALPLEVAGSILFKHLPELQACVTGNSPHKLGHFKICLDDCEMLSVEQQTFINSIVRRSNAPVFWIISYVSTDYETTATTIPGQILAGDDRRIVNLDIEPEEQFRRFCEHVSAMRFWYLEHLNVGDVKSRPSFSSQYFSLKKILGSFLINVSLAHVRKGALSALWEELDPLVALLATKRGFKGAIVGPDDGFMVKELEGHLAPPYYQAFVLKKLGRFDEVMRLTSVRDLTAISAAVRRKQRAAWLMICKQVGAELPFYGWQIAIALSDGCIRDYLEIMGEIFDVWSVKNPRLSDFRNTRVDGTMQRIAMNAAGSRKATSIATYSRRFTAEAYKLVSCLGHLTHLLQVETETMDPMRAAELGIFAVDFSDRPLTGIGFRSMPAEQIELVRNLIAECRRYGLLRVADPPGELSGEGIAGGLMPKRLERFRLHRRFAAAYGFSFRGPYGEVGLSPRDFVQICLTPDQVDAATWAQQIVRKLHAGPPFRGQEFLPLLDS